MRRYTIAPITEEGWGRRHARRRPLALAIVVILACLIVGSADAGRAPSPECWWEGTVLHGVNLPDEYSVTLTANPTGVFPGPDPYVQDFWFSTTAYFWSRGGPYPALFKPGRQLNDYKPICIAEPT